MIQNEKVSDIVENYPYSKSKKIKSLDEDFYFFVEEKYEGDTFSEKIYVHLNGLNESFCCLEDCDNRCSFDNFSSGFRKYCSYECQGIARERESRINKKCLVCKEEFEVRKCESDQKTCSVECRNEYLSRDEVVEERIQKTRKRLEEKYGDETYRNVEKAKKTKKERYGDPNYNNIEKMKETKKERYGDENYSNKEKAKKTKKEKYGDPHYNNRKKYRETIKERYGIESPLEKEEFKENRRETLKEKYGDPKYNNREQFIETFKERYGAKGWFGTEEGKEVVRNWANKNGFGTERFEKKMKEKYGSSNVWEVDEIREKMLDSIEEKYGHRQISKTEYYRKKVKEIRYQKHYDKLVNTDRLSNKVEPLFDLEDYNGTSLENKYPFLCLDCDEKFEDHLNSGHVPRCPKCYPVKKYDSYGEKEICEFLKSNIDCEIIKHDRDLLDGKELDIYIPEKNIAIEFNGLYWHSEISGKKGKMYHFEKTEKCENQNVQLIHIFEDEWINKCEIVKNNLKCMLGVNDHIYAKNCKVKRIDEKEKNELLEKYHLRGSIQTDSHSYGLIKDNKVVSIMSLGKNRFSENGWEIYRFSHMDDFVVNASSKLFSHFLNEENPEKVVGYLDRRWFSRKNNFYRNIDFELESVTNQNYWYTYEYRDRYNRMNFKKSKLQEKLKNFDSDLTEWENMKKHGYDRIWGCGNLKFVWERKN